VDHLFEQQKELLDPYENVDHHCGIQLLVAEQAVEDVIPIGVDCRVVDERVVDYVQLLADEYNVGGDTHDADDLHDVEPDSDAPVAPALPPFTLLNVLD